METDYRTLTLQRAVDLIVSAIRSRLTGRAPLVVAMDGGSGAGKSTLVAEVASLIGATVIQCDDFFAATVTDAEWDSCSADQKCRRCIDWNRVRAEALEPLLAGRKAQYHPFSLGSEDGLAAQWVRKETAPVIILDGIYSANPDLADVVDLTVLVNALPEVRRRRHDRREGHADLAWHARWDPAEAHYLTAVRPPASFDLVVDTGDEEMTYA